MDKNKLSKSEAQLLIIKEAKERIMLNRNTNLLEAVYMASRKLFGKLIKVDLFTLENAKIACKEKKVKAPDNSVYWFDKDNKKSKLAFCNWIIQKLEA